MLTFDFQTASSIFPSIIGGTAVLFISSDFHIIISAAFTLIKPMLCNVKISDIKTETTFFIQLPPGILINIEYV